MSQNIFGYQGVNTPLESLTNGRYNVADYTTLKETTNVRLVALERQQSYPLNVSMYGKLDVFASSALPGNITAAGSVIAQGNMEVAGNLVIGASGILFNDNTIQLTAAGSVLVNDAYNTTGGEIFTPTSQLKKYTYINLLGNANCQIDLSAYFPLDFSDRVQYLVVTKLYISAGDYSVTFTNLPADYDVFLKNSIVTAPNASFSIPAGVMSWTLMQVGSTGSPYAGRYVLINSV